MRIHQRTGRDRAALEASRRPAGLFRLDGAPAKPLIDPAEAERDRRSTSTRASPWARRGAGCQIIAPARYAEARAARPELNEPAAMKAIDLGELMDHVAGERFARRGARGIRTETAATPSAR